MTKITKAIKPNPRKPKAPVASKKASGASSRARKVKVQEAEVALTELQLRFVEHYLVDLNATQAAIRAGYSEKTARQMGAENLSKPVIQAAIAAARLEQQERTQITADRVLREAWNQVTADARELSAVHYNCCRYCYGKGHRYQWRDEDEFAAAVARITCLNEERRAERKALLPVPTDAGGYGFDRRATPNDECPNCYGDGIIDVKVGDTRKLSPAALSLYAGVKQTKFGIEVLTHSKDAAMEKLFKHLGLYERDNQQRVDPLTSLLHNIAQGNGNGFMPVAKDPEHGQDES
ncbi:terminase small subunit [Pseudomonas nitroreducens]|uniref:Terminase small subunit n=1 Tax=Pseudomonas nitroreducens TaxID=46680 RepID=A0A5R8ZQ44_PSENT|nr:terminase small subunit [Pseudomonas nitroreducens]TLP68225.1 terminase small subunit [Pseudomonas nitroreducens]